MRNSLGHWVLSGGKAVVEEYGSLCSPGKEAAYSQTTLNKHKLCQVAMLFSGNSLLFGFFGSWTPRLRKYFQGHVLLPIFELLPQCLLFLHHLESLSFSGKTDVIFCEYLFILSGLFYGSHFSAILFCYLLNEI